MELELARCLRRQMSDVGKGSAVQNAGACRDAMITPGVAEECRVRAVAMSTIKGLTRGVVQRGCGWDPPERERKNGKNRFWSIGLWGKNTTKPFVSPVDTLYNFMTRFNRTHLDILKIDIEWSEWNVFELAKEDGSLSKADVLMIEIHFDRTFSYKKYIEQLEAIESIEKLGFLKYFAHLNPLSIMVDVPGMPNNKFPCCYELCFIKL